MISCSAHGCNNTGNVESGITKHSFPKNKALRNNWIAALQLSKLNTSDNFVCSIHFRSEDFDLLPTGIRLKDNAIPSIFPALKENYKMEGLDIKDEPMELTSSFVNDVPAEEVIAWPTVSHLNSMLINDPLFKQIQASGNGNTFIVLKPVGNNDQKSSLLIPSNLLLQNGIQPRQIFTKTDDNLLLQNANQPRPILPKTDNNLIPSNLNTKQNSSSIMQPQDPCIKSVSSIPKNCNPVIVKTAKYKVNVNGIVTCKPTKKKSNNIESITETSSSTNVETPLDSNVQATKLFSNVKPVLNSKTQATKPFCNVESVPNSKTQTTTPLSPGHVYKNILKRKSVALELPSPVIEETEVKDLAKCIVIEKFSGCFILEGFNDIRKSAASNFSMQRIISLIEVIDAEKKKFICKLCLHQCAFEKNIIRHIRTKHKSNEGFKCFYCNYETPFEMNLENHFKTVHDRGY